MLIIVGSRINEIPEVFKGLNSEGLGAVHYDFNLMIKAATAYDGPNVVDRGLD